MNKYIAKFIDNYALHQLHKDRSKKSHFCISKNPPVSTSDINDFYPIPSTPKISFKQQDIIKNYNIGWYSYESEIDNGASNKYSTGMYYENNTKNQAANVILVDGWRMGDTERTDKIFLKSFMNLGFNIYHITLPYHFVREPEESQYTGELMVTTNIDLTLQSVKQAVTDIRALIRWLKENRPGKVIVSSISFGGFISNLTAVVEKNIDALISAFYANCIAYSTWDTKPGIYIKKDFEDNGFSYEELKKAWEITDPSNFKPLIPKDYILLFSGIYDQFVVIEDTDKLWKAWDCPKRILYSWGHAGLVFCRKKIAKESIEFLKERIL